MAAAGTVKPHQPVPSVREMKRATGLSIVTVQRAYTELKQEGTLYSRHGAGYFLAEQKKRSNTVAIFLPSEHLSLYLYFLQGAHAKADEHGLTIRLHSLGTDKLSWGRETIRALAEAKREHANVIFIQEAFGEVRERCAETAAAVPFVSVEWILSGTAVINDYACSAAAGFRYLIDKRHARSVLVLTGREAQYNAQMKIQGIKDAAAHASFGDIEYRATDFDAYSAYHAVKSSLKRNHPDAIFCANDYEAVGACGALTEAALLPGKDVAVLGYGNFLDKATSHFPITTIDQHWRIMGERAVEAVARISRGDAKDSIVEVAADLVIGAT